MSRRELEIRVPASIANLGPGFDTLAVAVQLYLNLSVTVLDGKNELTFEFPGITIDGENYIERAFHFAARQRGGDFPSLHVVVHTEIPMKSGLGSSAAATVAGLRLYEAVAGPLPEQGLLNAACALEGHPDNVAAALVGGVVVGCGSPDGIRRRRRRLGCRRRRRLGCRRRRRLGCRWRERLICRWRR